jgi:cold shock CspA family protein
MEAMEAMEAPVGATGPLRGIVTSFDTSKGRGSVQPEGECGTMLGFHCTSIADGTRCIEPGTAVSFLVRPAVGGCWEARSVTQQATG